MQRDSAPHPRDKRDREYHEAVRQGFHIFQPPEPSVEDSPNRSRRVAPRRAAGRATAGVAGGGHRISPTCRQSLSAVLGDARRSADTHRRGG
jgi:hypothetical protein